MRVANGVYVLPIPRTPQEPESFLNLTLIVDEQNGNTLVDAGLPGQAEAIGAALIEAGTGVRDLRRIIFTHQDLDHVGSGAALVRQSGARVLAHSADAPHIDGSLRLLKPSRCCASQTVPSEASVSVICHPLGIRLVFSAHKFPLPQPISSMRASSASSNWSNIQRGRACGLVLNCSCSAMRA